MKVRIRILASDFASKLYILQVSVGVNQIGSSRLAIRGGNDLMLPSLSEKTTLQSWKYEPLQYIWFPFSPGGEFCDARDKE